MSPRCLAAAFLASALLFAACASSEGAVVQAQRELGPQPADQTLLFAEAEKLAAEQLAGWKNLTCPAAGVVDDAFLNPVPNDGSTPLDIRPADGWLRYEVVHVVDLELPRGIMLESDGNVLGDAAEPVRIADAGIYPFFMALSVYDDHTNPALGQLVLDATAEPVRWVDDDRLGFLTDGGTGWLGSPQSALPSPTNGGEIANTTWSIVREQLSDIDRTSGEYCTIWQRSDGSNFVHYRSGVGDGFFPAAAGYDADNNLVAVTWLYGNAPWTLAGIPGTPPTDVQEQFAAN